MLYSPLQLPQGGENAIRMESSPHWGELEGVRRGAGGEAFRLQNYISPHLPANYWYILLVFVTKVWVDGMNGMKM